MPASAAAGHRKFLPKRRPTAAKQGVKFSSPGSAGFAGQAQSAKKPS